MKGGNDNDTLAHPDNQKLQKGTSDKYSPVDNGRRCTDFLFLLLLILAWLAMTGIGLASSGFIENESIKKGDPNRLVNGMDYHANICGISNFVTSNGDDTIDLPKAYPMPSGFFVCIESCPAVSDYDSFVCEYEVQHEIDEAVKAAELEGIVDIANAKKSLHLFYTASKQCMPKITSVSFLGYCFPTTPLDQILLNESNATRDGDSSSNETSTGLTISTESETRPSSDFFDKAIADAATAKYVIFSFGCGMSLCLGIIFLIILQARILSILVWTMILSVDAGLLGAGIYTKQVSLTWASGARPGNEAVALFYASYVLYWLAGLWVCVVLYLRKRIVLAIACVREASSAISSQPVISLYPVLQVLGLFTFSIVWGIYMAFLASSGDIVGKCFCPATVDYELDANATISSVVESVDNLGCHEGCFMHKELIYSDDTKYAGFYMLFIWFWTSQFIVAVGQLVVSLSISLWYFSRNRKLIGNATFFRAVFIVSLYHLGTAAFGSLIIAVIKTLRAILTYVEKKAAKSRQKVVIVVLKMLKCLLWCIEKCMKFINKQAYIQTAIFGYPFCKAARMGFFLILRNVLRISAVSIVTQFVLFVGQTFITVASTVAGYLYLEMYYGDQLNFLMVPTVFIALSAYAASEMFNEVFGMAISTILQCFVADEEMFDGDDRFAPISLASTIDSTQQKISRKRKVAPE